MKRETRRVSTLAGLALLVVLAGCDKRNDTDDVADGPVASDSSREGSSLVRVIHANPDVAAIDVVADESPAFTGIAFKTVTPYKSVKDNLVEFDVLLAGTVLADTARPLAENRGMMADGDRYTLLVLPAEGDDTTFKARLRVLEEPMNPGEAGKARVRVVNAAKGVETVDVFIPTSTDPFFDDVDFGTEAGFKDLDAGAIRLVIRGDDNGPVLLTLPERTFEAGKTYTFILTNKSATGRQLEVITIEDDPATLPAGDSPAAY